MEMMLRFETSNLILDSGKTWYNHVCHRLKYPKLGITHIIEIYDDCSDCPVYQLGSFVGDNFKHLLTGEGEGVPEGKESCGGVWVEVCIFRPDLFMKVNGG